jgi:hypothetical protein
MKAATTKKAAAKRARSDDDDDNAVVSVRADKEIKSDEIRALKRTLSIRARAHEVKETLTINVALFSERDHTKLLNQMILSIFLNCLCHQLVNGQDVVDAPARIFPVPIGNV